MYRRIGVDAAMIALGLPGALPKLTFKKLCFRRYFQALEMPPHISLRLACRLETVVDAC